MKRTFKRPDGTEEVIEGTAEELAEYERKLKQESQKPRPDVLKGMAVGDLLDGQPITQAEMDAAWEWVKVVRGFKHVPQVTPHPTWPVVCQRCYCSPCNCSWYKTWTSTGTSLHDTLADRHGLQGLQRESLADSLLGKFGPLATCNCRERCVECQSDGYSDWGGHH